MKKLLVKKSNDFLSFHRFDRDLRFQEALAPAQFFPSPRRCHNHLRIQAALTVSATVKPVTVSYVTGSFTWRNFSNALFLLFFLSSFPPFFSLPRYFFPPSFSPFSLFLFSFLFFSSLFFLLSSISLCSLICSASQHPSRFLESESAESKRKNRHRSKLSRDLRKARNLQLDTDLIFPIGDRNSNWSGRNYPLDEFSISWIISSQGWSIERLIFFFQT